MNKKTIQEAIAEIQRELKMRDHVYPSLIRTNKLKRDTANHQYLALKKALEILEKLIPEQQNLFEND